MLRALICGAFHPNPYVFDVWPTKVCFIGHVCVCASAQKTNEKITRCSWLTFVTVIVRFHLYLLGMQRNFGSWKLLAENCIFGFWPKEWKQCSVSSFHSPSSCCHCAVWRSSQCSLLWLCILLRCSQDSLHNSLYLSTAHVHWISKVCSNNTPTGHFYVVYLFLCVIALLYCNVV